MTGIMTNSALNVKIHGKLKNRLTRDMYIRMTNLKSVPQVAQFLKNETSWGSLLSDIDTERIVTQTITGSARTVESGQTLLFPLYDGQLIKDVMDQSISSLLTGDYGNQNRAYVLSIQNGTSTQGLARNTSFLMQSAGYEVLEISNAPATEKTVIINRIGNSEAAKALGKFIRCTNIVDEDYSEEEESNGSAKADFTIILGKDFDGRIVR